MAELWDAQPVRVAPGRDMTGRELLDAWIAHLSRLRSDADRPESTTTWGLDDYVAALCVRDILESARSIVPADSQDELSRELEQADQVLRELTTVDPSRRVLRLSDVGDRKGWWWERTPIAGVAAQELRSRWLE